jgi:uncharacterized small protein (TIGR04563 family)
MAGTDKRKQSLYFTEETLAEIEFQAARLDRSLSWIVQAAWKVARREIRSTPGANDRPEAARATSPDGRSHEPNGR